MTFGEKLQTLRKQKGISQEQLAAELDISRQAVSKWELDACLPDTEKVIAISGYFNVSIDYLLKDKAESQESASAKGKNYKSIGIAIGGIACVAFSVISYFVVWILSKVYPAPIHVYNPDKQQWLVGLPNFISYHSLNGFMNLLFVLFIAGIVLIFHKKLLKLLNMIKAK